MKSAEDVSPVKTGEVVTDRYRVERVIGVGGMAVVVAATDLRLGHPVAIKFLLPHALLHPEIVTRFDREARAAVRVRSEHVARVMDVGKLESGAPYMVMEFLEGRDLAAELDARGPLPGPDAVDYVLQACEVLAEAHRLGMVHRDLKPANLFLVDNRGSPMIKVLDFGISKMSSLAGATGFDAGVTQSASTLGSPLYMSPEQMDSARDVDVRTDIWALGVVLYELLAARPPFTGDSIPKLCIAILNHKPAPLRSERPDVPPRLEATIMRCLEKDRTRRFGSIEELAMALAEFAPPRSRLSLERISSGSGKDLRDSESRRGSLTASADSVPGVAGRVSTGRGRRMLDSAESFSTQAGWGRTAAERRRGTARRWALVGIVTAGLVGALVFVLTRNAAAPEKPAATGSSAPAVTSSPAATAPEVRLAEPVLPPPEVAPAAPATGEAPRAAVRPLDIPTPGAPVPLRPRAKPKTQATLPSASAPSSHGPSHAPKNDEWVDDR
jgi:serine/threonine protein kinase